MTYGRRKFSTNSETVAHAMAVIFWVAITLSGIVGFIVFIAPHFVTDKLISFLERWRLLQNERIKLNELKLFALVTRLHTGKRDRYIFFTISSQIVGIVAILGAAVAVLGFLLLEGNEGLKKLIPFNIGIAGSVVVAFVEVILFLGVFAFFLTTSVRLFRRLVLIKTKLSNYEAYRKQVTKCWGKEEVSKIEAEL
jgi:hypothetical protein